MTRINVGYNPTKLTQKHLLAEHREIKRIPNTIVSGKAKIENIPDNFRLGTGHVKFFYTRLGYLLKRYKKIYQECIRRGYNVQNYANAWDGVPDELMGEWQPSDEDKKLIVDRINNKLN